MQEDNENKSVTMIINSSKLTARTLATVFAKFLHYAHNKAKEHRDVKPRLCLFHKKLTCSIMGGTIVIEVKQVERDFYSDLWGFAFRTGLQVSSGNTKLYPVWIFCKETDMGTKGLSSGQSVRTGLESGGNQKANQNHWSDYRAKRYC